ncbi:MAG: transglycosylase domain-containing protein [Lachnospiraceae bacterium]|nr:transglycosylase domain-containing protein [Lachnospiraceae bacterium]
MKLGFRDLERMTQKRQSGTADKSRIAGVAALKLLLLVVLIAVIAAVTVGLGVIRGILDNTPELTLTNVQPQGYSSKIYDAEGNLMQELVMAGTNREEVTYDQLPTDLVNAFIGIEDSRFWYHNGIDVKGILRAGFVALTTGRFSEGGSTITQQLIKNNLLEGGYERTLSEKFKRKLQEQYLAMELEKISSKTQILQDYLNTINLGSNCLGVQVASRRYFGKSVSDLNLSECTVLAAITSNPTAYNPITHPENNARRRQIVLSNMVEQGSISQEEMNLALGDDVYSRIQQINETVTSTSSTDVFSYFEDAVFQAVSEDLQEVYGYTASQANTLLYSGGLEIITTMDPTIQTIVDEEINNPQNYYLATGESLEEYSLAYNLSVTKGDGTVVTYNENDVTSYHKNDLDKPAFKNIFRTREELNQAVEVFRNYAVGADDVINHETIQVILQPQASLVVMDPYSGHVLAIAGGRGEKTGSLTLNRATDSARQPGSCFKILADFAPAIDNGGATLATTFYDAPYTANDQQIMNWWGTQYLGYNNIRQGIKYSMNVVAVKCLQSLVSPAVGYSYVENFGITTLVDSDKVPSIALGGITYGVYNLELAAAYSSIANDGIYNEPVFYTKVLDRSGQVILENKTEGTRILKSTTAALLTDAMVDTVSNEGIYNQYGIEPTGARCQVEGMTVAGKSGSTTDSNDVWFVGYSPYYTCSIWSGYDSSKALGTGQVYHKDLWQKIMTRIHEGKENREFVFSEELEYYTICSKSGLLAIDSVCNCEGSNAITYQEAFAPGTEPTEYCNRHYTLWICQESGQSAGIYCPDASVLQKVFFRIDDSDLASSVATLDTSFLAPSALQSCTIHTQPPQQTVGSVPNEPAVPTDAQTDSTAPTDAQNQPTAPTDAQSQPTATTDAQSQPTATTDAQNQPTEPSDASGSGLVPLETISPDA